MTEPTGTVFGKEATEQIAQTVREVSRRMMNEQPHRARWQNHRGGGRIIHGIVAQSGGGGFYTIEKAEWTGTEDTYAEHDPFDLVSYEGSENCGITLSIPAAQVSGTGVLVKAYDCASLVIPLVEGTHCLITNMGDTDTATGEPIWQVVQGFMNHIVKYEEEWDCCEPGGPETLIARTPTILIGVTGPRIICGECPY